MFGGATGRVGHLLRRAWSVTAADRPLWCARTAAPGIDLVWDMTTPPPAFPAAGGAAGVCLAGVTPGRGDLAANVTLALAAHRAASEWGLSHLFVVSTSAIYGATERDPVSEDTAPRPVNPYANAKHKMEQALLAQAAEADPPVTVLRLGNVAGASQPFLNAIEGEALRLDRFGDGHGPSRSYIGPLGLARVLNALTGHAFAGHRLPDVLNVAAPQPAEMAAVLAALETSWEFTPAGPDAVQFLHLDTTRLEAICPGAAGHGTAEALVAELRSVPRSAP